MNDSQASAPPATVAPGMTINLIGAHRVRRVTVSALVVDPSEHYFLLVSGGFTDHTGAFNDKLTQLGQVSRCADLFGYSLCLIDLAPRVLAQASPPQEPEGIERVQDESAALASRTERVYFYAQGTRREGRLADQQKYEDLEAVDRFLIVDIHPATADEADIGGLVVSAETGEGLAVIVGMVNDSTLLALPLAPILHTLNVQVVSESGGEHTAPAPQAAAPQPAGPQPDSHAYAVAFARLVVEGTAPFAIGTFGGRGSGKSFLMQQVRDALPPATAGPEFAALVVQISGWELRSARHVWSAVLQRVFAKLNETAEGHRWSAFWLNLRRGFQTLVRNPRRLLPVGIIELVIGIWVGIIASTALVDLTWPLTLALLAFLGIIVLYRVLHTLVMPYGERLHEAIASGDYKSNPDFAQQVYTDLSHYLDRMPQDTRVVLIIDELDETTPQQAVAMLETISDFFTLPEFVIFLVMDLSHIIGALMTAGGTRVSDTPLAAYQYLDRLLLVPFVMPDPDRLDLGFYLGDLVKLPSPGIEETLAEEPDTDAAAVHARQAERRGRREATGDQPASAAAPEVSDFRPEEKKAFVHLRGDILPNPRIIKRVVNIYRLVRYLLLRSKDDAVRELLSQPRHVIGWLVVCTQWPHAAYTMLAYFREEAIGPASGGPQTVSDLFLHSAERIETPGPQQDLIPASDLPYERLAAFIGKHLADFDLAALGRLRPYVRAYFPLLHDEVRLTLADFA
jgi:xanthosine utilization system XapX-like protein